MLVRHRLQSVVGLILFSLVLAVSLQHSGFLDALDQPSHRECFLRAVIGSVAQSGICRMVEIDSTVEVNIIVFTAWPSA